VYTSISQIKEEITLVKAALREKMPELAKVHLAKAKKILSLMK
jgi:hypothetical protein